MRGLNLWLKELDIRIVRCGWRVKHLWAILYALERFFNKYYHLWLRLHRDCLWISSRDNIPRVTLNTSSEQLFLLREDKKQPTKSFPKLAAGIFVPQR